MLKVLVLGLGNEILGDDAIGIIVARELSKYLDKSIDIKETFLSGLELLDIITGYDIVFIIDSIKTNDPPGTLYELDIKNLPKALPLSPHYTGVPELIAIATAIGYKMPKRIKILAINVKDPYTIREGISYELKEKLPKIIRKIIMIINKEIDDSVLG